MTNFKEGQQVKTITPVEVRLSGLKAEIPKGAVGEIVEVMKQFAGYAILVDFDKYGTWSVSDDELEIMEA